MEGWNWPTWWYWRKWQRKSPAAKRLSRKQSLFRWQVKMEKFREKRRKVILLKTFWWTQRFGWHLWLSTTHKWAVLFWERSITGFWKTAPLADAWWLSSLVHLLSDKSALSLPITLKPEYQLLGCSNCWIESLKSMPTTRKGKPRWDG